jgi:hypothetical protein
MNTTPQDQRTSRRMRATLVRFGEEQFEELKLEAARQGVSVAQFVREAVVARIAYSAGRREDGAEGRLADATRARTNARRVRSESGALRAEGAQARTQSDRIMKQTGRKPADDDR